MNIDIFKKMVNPPYEVCLLAVKSDGMILQCVENPTEELCMEAVKQNGLALQFVENPTEKLCIEAVKQNGMALQFIENPTYDMYLLAVKSNSKAIQFVKNPTEELCEIVMKIKPEDVRYIQNPSEELQMFIVSKCPYGIHFLSNPTEDVCYKAISINPFNIKYIQNPSRDMCLFALSRYVKVIWVLPKDIVSEHNLSEYYGLSIEGIRNYLSTCDDSMGAVIPYFTFLIDAVTFDYDLLDDIIIKYPYVFKYVLKNKNLSDYITDFRVRDLIAHTDKDARGCILEYIENPSFRLCICAVLCKWSNIQYVKSKRKRALIKLGVCSAIVFLFLSVFLCCVGIMGTIVKPVLSLF